MTPEEIKSRIASERKADRDLRASAKAAPKGKRPHCLYCRRELWLYRWRKAGDKRLYGTYGDNRFCGQGCGYRWALNHTSDPLRN